MNSKLSGMLGTLAIVMLSAFPSTPSHATNINYGTNQCQVAFYALATYAPQYTNNGVMNPGSSQNSSTRVNRILTATLPYLRRRFRTTPTRT